MGIIGDEKIARKNNRKIYLQVPNIGRIQIYKVRKYLGIQQMSSSDTADPNIVVHISKHCINVSAK